MTNNTWYQLKEFQNKRYIDIIYKTIITHSAALSCITSTIMQSDCNYI